MKEKFEKMKQMIDDGYMYDQIAPVLGLRKNELTDLWKKHMGICVRTYKLQKSREKEYPDIENDPRFVDFDMYRRRAEFNRRKRLNKTSYLVYWEGGITNDTRANTGV